MSPLLWTVQCSQCTCQSYFWPLNFTVVFCTEGVQASWVKQPSICAFHLADLENECRSWHWQSIMPPDRQQLVTQESFDGNSGVCNSKSASAVESQLHSRATCHFLLQYHCWFWAGLVYWFVSFSKMLIDLSHFISWWLLCWPWTGYLGFFAFSLNANRSCRKRNFHLCHLKMFQGFLGIR